MDILIIIEIVKKEKMRIFTGKSKDIINGFILWNFYQRILRWKRSFSSTLPSIIPKCNELFPASKIQPLRDELRNPFSFQGGKDFLTICHW